MPTTVNDYRVRIVDEKNRINELLEECRYDIMGIPHLDMNEFVERLVRETIKNTETAIDSGLPIDEYVLKQFGVY
jgi:hypothetical protein